MFFHVSLLRQISVNTKKVNDVNFFNRNSLKIVFYRILAW